MNCRKGDQVLSVNRLSQWLIDNFVLSFQLGNMVFLAIFNAIKMKVWRCCGIVSEERSPNREMEGERRDAGVEDLGPKPPNWCAEPERVKYSSLFPCRVVDRFLVDFIYRVMPDRGESR